MTKSCSSDESGDEEEAFQTETLPKKSANRYMLIYDTYKKWQIDHISSLSDSQEKLTSKLKPPTLWSIWSMLKKTLNTRDNVDISYKPKKSLVLKWTDIVIILIFGICRTLRCDELKNLKVQDIEDLGNRNLVSINETKHDKPRQFIIGEHFYDKVKKYTSLRPSDLSSDRFFIQYQKEKCVHQVIGRNKIRETPQAIASYLDLQDANSYTGHCFRRTGATLLSDSDANITILKQLGGWKSTNIAQVLQQCRLSTSKNSLSKIIANKSALSEAVDDDVFDDIEITDFTTARNTKIDVPSSKESTPPKHFSSRLPVKVSFKSSENEPPLKKVKHTESKSCARRQVLQYLSDESIRNNSDVNFVDLEIQNNVSSDDRIKTNFVVAIFYVLYPVASSFSQTLGSNILIFEPNVCENDEATGYSSYGIAV
ncbi:hypothetical protein TSAR_016695 [Trichomalopsis sarcophagae]|uniref:Tyr recombinase domain-containing protein n=1 Tax=Trichomalopsis sarcophagae TaxID=543379 RepID=A0A232EFB9_9HYME|nr:hypothetical protein TSAR_016695 [Trichomalopsis sarcophagae]